MNIKSGSGWMKHSVMAMAFIAASMLVSGHARAHHATPGDAGMTKVNIYDNTDSQQEGWNVTVGTPDPIIGFVNFRPTIPSADGGEVDPNHIVVVASVKNGAPNCTLTIELVTNGPFPNAGLQPDGFHSGNILIIGELTTNKNGHGNSGAIVVDVTTVGFPAPSGEFTYAHVDLEDYARECIEEDGTSVTINEYGASGQPPFSDFGLPVNIHWLQP